MTSTTSTTGMTQTLEETMTDEVVTLRGYIERTAEMHKLSEEQRGAHTLLSDLMQSKRVGGMCKAIRRFRDRMKPLSEYTAFGKGYADMFDHVVMVHDHYVGLLP